MLIVPLFFLYRVESMSHLQNLLLQLAHNGNPKFTQSLHPGVDHILGVRVPDMRTLAKKVAADSSWEDYLSELTYYYMEERMLHGMVLGYIKQLPLEERLQKLREFIPLINSWSVCDTVCSTLRFTEKNKALVWLFIEPYFNASDEYAVRFAVVMSLSYYVEKQYLKRLFGHFDQISHQGYYVKMAVAWAISVCFVKYPVETEHYLSNNHLDSFIQNKSIQKICESYRVTDADKERIKCYKRL